MYARHHIREPKSLSRLTPWLHADQAVTSVFSPLSSLLTSTFFHSAEKFQPWMSYHSENWSLSSRPRFRPPCRRRRQRQCRLESTAAHHRSSLSSCPKSSEQLHYRPTPASHRLQTPPTSKCPVQPLRSFPQTPARSCPAYPTPTATATASQPPASCNSQTASTTAPPVP